MLDYFKTIPGAMGHMPSALVRNAVLVASVLLMTGANAQFAVSDSGTATYRYDLSPPPGIGGMTPSLSISYAAGSGNGPLGYGWSLQGVSVITRCQSTLATDKVSAGVIYGPTDKLCLDGQRLIQTNSSGVPLPASSQVNDAQGLATYREYRTEKDIYARIRAYGYANGDTTGASGPAYFKVWYKSGQIAEFGAPPAPTAEANPNALITNYTSAGNGVPMVWAIARLSNTFGNTINFKYEQRAVAWGSSTSPANPPGSVPPPDMGREWALREIQYSGNKIVFNYLVDDSEKDIRTDKSEIELQNISGKTVSSRLLKSINYYVNSPNTNTLGKGINAVAVKNVLLSYTNGPFTGRSLINKIQECVGESSTRCMPGPVFGYTQGSNEAFSANSNFSASSLATTILYSGTGSAIFVVPLDVNGDGKTDLLQVNAGDLAGQMVINNRLWISLGSGNFREVPAGASAGQFNLANVNLTTRPGCGAQSHIVDLNGDGLPDFFVVGSYCTGVAQANYVYINNGDGSFQKSAVTGLQALNPNNGATLLRSPQAVLVNTSNLSIGLSTGQAYFMLDVNGDGKIDMVTTESAGTSGASCVANACTKIYRGDGLGGFTQGAYSGVDLFSATDPLEPEVVDVDGDGINDLYFWRQNWNWSGGGLGSPSVGYLRSRGDGTFETFLQRKPELCRLGVFIDYNGGGKTRCLILGLTASTNSLTGLTNFTLNNAAQVLGSTDGSQGVELIDVNGDGRQDILSWNENSAKNALYLSNGDGTFRYSSTFNLGSLGTNLSTKLRARLDTNYVTGDFTGRGGVEILRLSKSYVNTTVDYVGNNILLTKSDATPPDLLNLVTSGMGARTNIYYVPLGDPTLGGITRYVSDARNASYAVANAQDKTPSMYVVARTITDAGIGAAVRNAGGTVPTATTEYSYAGLKKDTRGRGWLGFREVRRQIVAPNGEALTTVTQRMQAHPYTGMTASAKTYRGAINATGSAALLSSSTNVYCDQTNAVAASASVHCPVTSMVARPYVYQSTSAGNDLVGNVLPQETTTVKQISDSGEPLEVQSRTSGWVAGVTQTFTKTVVNTPDPVANNTACTGPADCAWVIGRMSQTSVNSEVPNSAAGVSTPGVQLVLGAKANLSGVNIAGVPRGTTGVKSPAVLTNTGNISLDVLRPDSASVNGSKFSFSSTDCPASLAVGAKCNIWMDFNTSTTGSANGSAKVFTSAGMLTAAISFTVSEGQVGQVGQVGQGTFASAGGSTSGPASIAVFTNTGSGTITGITGRCQNSGIGSVSVSATSVAPGAQVAVVGISQTAPSNAGYCRAVISGTNATNSPYTSPTY